MKKMSVGVKHKALYLILFFATLGLDIGAGYLLPVNLATFYWLYPSVETICFLIIIYLAIRMGAFEEFVKKLRIKSFLFIVFFILLGIFLSALVKTLYFHLSAPLDYVWSNQGNVNNLQMIIPHWYGLFLLFLAGPIMEEIAFRFYIFRFFKHQWLGFIISILAFTYIHSGFSLVAFYYAGAGIAFGLAYWRRKSVFESILVHIGMNLLLSFIVLPILW